MGKPMHKHSLTGGPTCINDTQDNMGLGGHGRALKYFILLGHTYADKQG